METYAKMICDSVSPLGVRLSSVEMQFPRFILPQILMHRQWSRSCESMRARPTQSKIAEVAICPVMPVFAKNQKGMKAGEQFDQQTQNQIETVWLDAKEAAVAAADKLSKLCVAKQWANRLLETFAYQKMIVTATDFSNFLRLRLADDAQPEIQELAVKLKAALDDSTPKERIGHYPYSSENEVNDWHLGIDALSKVCAARCARVSYVNHEGKRDVDKDLALAETLISSGHSNPFEHVCTTAWDDRRYGNLKGWISYRYRLEAQGLLPNAEG